MDEVNDVQLSLYRSSCILQFQSISASLFAAHTEGHVKVTHSESSLIFEIVCGILRGIDFLVLCLILLLVEDLPRNSLH